MQKATTALIIIIAAAVGLWEAQDSLAPSIAGRASVIDGDTLEVQGQRIRLFGIDAPEGRQVCQKEGKDYLCGKEAAQALDALIADRPVSCEVLDTDVYDRAVAICRVAEVEINRWLVANGHALAYRHYSIRYVPDEDAARKAKVGLWAGSFQKPWEFRHRQG